MTVHLNWPAEVLTRLSEEARQRGLSLDDYVLQAVLSRQPQNGAPDEAEKRRSQAEAGQRIRELRKGNVLGPETSIRDLIEEGRRF